MGANALTIVKIADTLQIQFSVMGVQFVFRPGHPQVAFAFGADQLNKVPGLNHVLSLPQGGECIVCASDSGSNHDVHVDE
jgi:hypothetical protein